MESFRNDQPEFHRQLAVARPYPDARSRDIHLRQAVLPSADSNRHVRLHNINVHVPNGTAQSGNVLTPPATANYLYDDEGNLLNGGLWAYTWDAENRLVAMLNVATSSLAPAARRRLTFEYDDRRRRIGKKVFAWSGYDYATTPTSISKFLYDGWNLVAELDGNNQQTRTYLWGNDLSGSLEGGDGVGGLLKVTAYTWAGNTPTVTHLLPAYDGNGNVAGLVDGSNGTITATYEYGPFGELIRANGPMAARNPIRFSSKYRDDESELVYYGHRFYSPSLGRWINRDPSGEHGDNSHYSFVGNHPSNAVDPTGLYEMDFHYDVIAYLLRAKRFSDDESDSIAYVSQEVDDNEFTTPLRLKDHYIVDFLTMDIPSDLKLLEEYHFFGSSPTKPTQLSDATTMGHVVESFNRDGIQFFNPFETGRALHTFADTFSHKGFTAYNNPTINGLSMHKDVGSYVEKYRRQPTSIGHKNFGSIPDYPFRRPALALAAAKAIYDLIPSSICSREKALPWSIVAADLSSFFSNTGNEYNRHFDGGAMIYRRFGNFPMSYDVSHRFNENDTN